MFQDYVRSSFALVPLLLGAVILTACVAEAPATTGAPATTSQSSFGLPSSVIVSGAEMSDLGEKLIVVMFYAAKTSASDLASAPAAICDSRKRRLVSSEVKDLAHPEEMPGVRKLVVRCK